MINKISILLVCSLLSIQTFSQIIKGKVIDTTNSEAVIGATVFWINYAGGGVSTGIDGTFELPKQPKASQLVVSAVGYRTDTLKASGTDFLEIKLAQSSTTLAEVTVKGTATVIDRLNPIQTEILTKKTLAKAACCNLSESFETNASISVSFADAVTGSKQLKLLGLAGNYIQQNIENIPAIRGLASTFGLGYVPGTWIQSIDISKGTGSVVTGYESMSGGLNVELMKPDNSEKFYLNAYQNSFGRSEINLHAAHKLTEKWSVGLLTHGSRQGAEIDNNGDDFLDLPKFGQINLLNRWKYSGEKLNAQFGVRYLDENRSGGQTGFESISKTPNLYGFTNDTKRLEFFSKTALLFPDKPYKGVALILNAVDHRSDSRFGRTDYNASQKYGYANFIYQNILGTTEHTYKVGGSLVFDEYEERYGPIDLNRREVVPGVYGEYTYNHLDRTVLVLGNRADFHNLYGLQFSPRLHLKQKLSQNLDLRASVGSGFRVPNRLVETYGNLISSRQVVFLDALNLEKSWNFGASLTRTFGKSTLIADYYFTDFVNKLITDTEHPGYIYFYESEGKAFASAFQIEYNYAPNDRWDAKLAYRFLDTKQTMGKPLDEQVLLPLMFQSRDRILFNVGYSLPYDKWKADLTLNWNGKSRIAETDLGYDHTSYKDMPIKYAPDYLNVNAQVTRTFVNWEYYLGGENLTNFRQKNPIVDPFNPYGNRFDAGMIWGPVTGRMFYAGLRYKIR